MQALLDLDQRLFLWINQGWTNSFFDSFFPAITDLHKDPFFMGLFVMGIFVLCFRSYRWKGVWIFVGLLIALGFSDFIGGQLIKPWVGRLRPSVAGIEVISRSPHFGGFSFPSNHALNMFCAATYLTFFFRRWTALFFTLAGLVAFSRIYVGVHYPLDVICAALLGSIIGYLIARSTLFFLNKKGLP